jgi:hypothetical protein
MPTATARAVLAMLECCSNNFQNQELSMASQEFREVWGKKATDTNKLASQLIQSPLAIFQPHEK